MHYRKWLTLALSVILILSAVPLASAQEAIVHGVFFYSPTCPHCVQVIQNDWPKIQTEFGDQLQVIFINASSEEGGRFMQVARAALQIESSGVPMLIIGSNVFMGSIQIPTNAPDVIRAGLAAGGIDLPAIPGIQTIYEAALAGGQSAPDHTTDSATNVVTETQSLSWLDRLAADPVANALAIVILVALVATLLIGGLRLISASQIAIPLTHPALLIASIAGALIAASLLFGAQGQPLILAIAAGELVIFALLVWASRQAVSGNPVLHWRVPLTALAGLVAAAYLATIEVNQTDAVCGLVGDCNRVQQSPYAQIAGIPIGVIGVLGYIAILILWFVNRQIGGSYRLEQLMRAAALLGVVFSTYLTFLEPFVIGATCLWCLMSAIIMLLLLWMLLPEGITAPLPPRTAAA
ncbi:MAG TPA: vitamin K epoxide reductase family protein [Aggregatilineales bacterium]|nr:vitamin K epoxide reductase family protein [Aggregatilineales bacterium]